MKNFRHSLLLSLFVFLSASALTCATSAPALDVVVSNSAGKLVYKGKVDATGVFTTPKLAPGSYVVQFDAKSSIKGGPFALVIGVGKKKVTADSVPAGKFTKGGVAMKVEVAREMSLTGQVADAGGATAATIDPKSKGKVKYINGRKYVWVAAELGSNLGGRWVEAGSPEGRNVQNVGTDALRDYQARSQNPGGGN